MDSLDERSGHANTAKERLRKLPALSTKVLVGTDGTDYGRFALSPLTTLAYAKYRGAQWTTPVTAVHIKNTPIMKAGEALRNPMIRTPGTPLRATILDRYLADNCEVDAISEASIQPHLTLAAAGISDALPTPVLTVPWSPVMSSVPETNSDCYSPVLGTGPAEQDLDLDLEPRSAASYKSEGEPQSALSGRSVQSTKSLPAWVYGSGRRFKPWPLTRNTEELIQEKGNVEALTRSTPEDAAITLTQCSPTSSENTFVEEEFGTAQAAVTVPDAKMARSRKNSFPQLFLNNKQRPQVTAVIPTPGEVDHPHPLRSAPVDAPDNYIHSSIPAFSRDQEEQMKMAAPPSAPTADSFADRLPEVKIRIEPSPYSPPPAPTVGFFTVCLPEPVASIDPSPFDPPPAPTLSSFREDFPASPIHAGPAPIDTTIPFGAWRRTQEPGSTMNSPVLPTTQIRSIDPPPAPTQGSFSEVFPASPLRSKPAPIDTISPREESKFSHENGTEMPPPAPLVERFDVKSPVPRDKDVPPPSSVLGRRGTKSTKVVRFAAVDSPTRSFHFKAPLSPHPWYPRALGVAYNASIPTPLVDEPFADGENRKPPMTDMLLDGTTPRGRTGRRLKNVGRLTRSVSPKGSRNDEPVNIGHLPSTVYNRHNDQPHSAISPVRSDKHIILQTYFNPSRSTCIVDA